MRICVIFALWVLITVSVVPALGQTSVKATEYGPTSAFAVSVVPAREVVPALDQTTAESKINPASNEAKVPEKHTYMVGTPGINEFILNWTDNKVYSSTIDAQIIDQQDTDLGDLTAYHVRILDESEKNVTLGFSITWHPNVKRPSAFTLEKNYPYILETDGVLSRSDFTIQGKKALMLTYKDKKEYQGSKSKPRITPAHYFVLYFLDDYTEIRINGDLVDWPAQEFKSMLSSMKIAPPEGYY